MGENAWSAADVVATLSREPYGIDLAQQVGRRLVTKDHSLCYSHRDYCGLGLFYQPEKQSIILSYVEDGFQAETVKEFMSVEAFVQWLSIQSDYSLSGASTDPTHLHETQSFVINNQRINRDRLENFVNRKD
jgi:hypothetical protein